MQAFKIHQSVIEEYKNYLNSFILIKDERIRRKVEEAFRGNTFLPEGLIQFNPSYKTELTLGELERDGKLVPELKKIFGDYKLYQHQVEAIRKGINEESFVVTSGTGSGKSLTFLATIFNSLLQEGEKPGITAFLVYPMNALINSQEEEIKKYEINYLRSFLSDSERDYTGVGDDEGNTGGADGKSLDDVIRALRMKTGKRFPITYAKYSGQEDQETRDRIKEEKPNIILTNYMMLELIMTRNTERWLRDSMKESLKYLVFDELHTYRGRQGSDVAMLIRRIRNHCPRKLIFIGTSATMASAGMIEQRKDEIARVAGHIFGEPFSNEQVITETLQTCTRFTGKVPEGFDLQEAIHGTLNVDGSSEAFVTNKLAIWLENRIALKQGPDGILERGEPLSLSRIILQLAEDSGESPEACRMALLRLLQWSERLTIEGGKKTPRESYLPFKVHQFISQTGNVYVTLEAKDVREITLDAGRYIKKEGQEKPIFPTLFSRYTGYDFICVRKDFEQKTLLPRESDDLPERITKADLKGDREAGIKKRILTEEDFPDGYILMDDEGESIWSDEDAEYLPDHWFRVTKTETKLDNFYEFRLPRRISFNSDGQFAMDESLSIKGWFIAAPLLLDPTSGIIFERTNENTKLMRLGNEGRSTATTVLSYSLLKTLNEERLPIRHQKILSFTDNRQDASLQAGHFNDFLMVGRLRSALYYALRSSSDHALNIDTITNKVFQQLRLTEEEYARNPSRDPGWPDSENEKAIQDYILVRLLYDLKRSWRFTAPNLEHCGLLTIIYNRLNEFCSRDEFFKDVFPFNSMNTNEREQIFIQLLNYFRTSYAFDYYKLTERRTETEERIKNRLDEEKIWSLDIDEKIDDPCAMIIQSVGEIRDRIYVASIGPRSYFGKYLKRLLKKAGHDPANEPELVSYIEQVCSLLERGHFLSKRTVRGRNGETDGYRLRLDSVIWNLGNGLDIIPDEVRIQSFRSIRSRPNDFFRKFYQQDFAGLGHIFEGREHTGQTKAEQRIEREEKFRNGKISALFCSPTMELGIDIAELNMVHMRNVPPSPANYVQRGGRAGRSGQAALVYTYCSNGSPHDRNYFRDSLRMISGTVTAPRIDLTNEELLISHLNAFILMEMGLKDLHVSVAEVLDCANITELPVKEEIKSHILDHLERYSNEWILQYRTLVDGLPEIDSTYWYSDAWITTHVKSFFERFDQSFERWRILYRSAQRLIDHARSVMDDPTISADNVRKNEAKREHGIGMRQRELLLNQGKKQYGNDSEFYVYRYLASEGFLPGYNFTRLPVRAFLGFRHIDKGDFVSRPRFVAIREFGPNNVIYHDGEKFRINKMQLTQADIIRHSIKISKKTGYGFLDEEAKGVNNDPITDEELQGQDRVEIINNLIELSESDARPEERISCEEEERMAAGYDLDQYFSFPKGIASTREVTIKEGGEPLLQVHYNQSAKLIQINRGWRNSRDDEGFHIGRVSGRWKKKKELDNPNPDDPAMRVKIFTTTHADVLYIQPIGELKLDEGGVASLSFALKRAMEKQFQVEENELGVWIMGKGEHKNILLYESSQGSLGVLSQLTENTQLLQALFEEAYRLLHFDSETLEDMDPEIPKATYDDLLSYYNQRYHDILDRYSVKAALEKLMNCTIEENKDGKSPEEQYRYLMEHYDLNSSTEKPLIEFLYKNGYSLPDKAQINVSGCYVNADFVYKTSHGYALVFCDGSVHDDPDVQADDRKKRQCCRDAGYDVVEWHYREPLEQLVERRKDLFRKIR